MSRRVSKEILLSADRSGTTVARTVVVCSVAAVMWGCESQPTYPGFDAAKEYKRAGLTGMYVRSCPKLGGRYWDKGHAVETDGSSGETLSLTSLLAGPPVEADLVTISYAPDEKLVIESWREGEKVSTWTRPPWNPFTVTMRPETELDTSYMCAGDTIAITFSISNWAIGVGSFGAGIGALGANASQLHLSERADGALAARYVESRAGVIAIVPYYESRSRWARFEAAPVQR